VSNTGKHMGWCFLPQTWTADLLKNILIVPLKLWCVKPPLARSKLSLTLCPDRRKVGFAACPGTVSPAIFTSALLPQRPAPTQERQVKTQKPVLSYVLWAAPKVYSWGAKDKISIYVVNMTFSKILTFKGMIRQILSRSAGHVWVLRHVTICLVDKFISCQYPCKVYCRFLIHFRSCPVISDCIKLKKFFKR
jgi:hypothetical protein